MFGQRIRTRVASAVAALTAVIVTASCVDQPSEPGTDLPNQPFQSARPAQAVDVPAVSIDRPPTPRPWDTSDSALVQALTEQDGHATIAFKHPGSARALQTGERAAVSAATITAATQILLNLGVEILLEYRSIGGVAARMDPAIAPGLRAHPLIDFIEPRQWFEVQTGTMASAPAAAAMGQTTPWGISLVHAPEAWAATTGYGAKVEIIDTGHDRGHQDLPLVPTGNCGGIYGGCDDGPFWHGTHVFGILGARNNSLGVVGVAPGLANSDVYVWGACESVHGACPTAYIADGIDAARFAGVDVINMSLGGSYDAGIATAVAQAWNAGIVLVAAAGNRSEYRPGGYLVYPAAHDNVIGVSGVRPDKSFASTSPCPHYLGGKRASNYGAHVDLAAPFWALSTVGNNGYEDESDDWCGTSMATPHVAGAAALLRALHASWTNQQIVDRLFAAAEDRGSSGRDNYYGYGLLNVAAAVNPLSVTIQGPQIIETQGSYSWEAMPTGGASPYSYQWQYCSPGCSNVGTAKTYSRYVASGDDDFTLKVTVTSSDSQTATDSHYVYVRIGHGNQW